MTDYPFSEISSALVESYSFNLFPHKTLTSITGIFNHEKVDQREGGLWDAEYTHGSEVSLEKEMVICE